jgi:cytosine deaminase
MFAQMPSQLLTGAHVAAPDGTMRSVDIRIVDGSIAAVGDLRAGPDESARSLAGYLVLPAAVEAHAHLDKAFLADRIANPTGDLRGAIEAMEQNRASLTVADIVARGVRAAELMARNGFRAVRTHADVTTDNGLRSVEGLIEVRRRVAEVIDVEIVALCGWPVLGRAGADQRALLRDALDLGIDVVGGCPHLEDGGIRPATEYLLGVAVDRRLPVDLHTDETLDPAILGLADLAEIVADGFPHPVTASHCVSLSMVPRDEQRQVAEQVAAAGIGVIALPHTNLYLQGRGHAPMPRGLTAVAVLREAGVTVAAGGDNLQDPFNPLGRGCPLETAGLMMLTCHLSAPEAYDTVGAAAAIATGRAPAGVEAGAPADLLAVRADSLRHAIAFTPEDRIALRRGREIGIVRDGEQIANLPETSP